jgi:hypothetical protein
LAAIWFHILSIELKHTECKARIASIFLFCITHDVLICSNQLQDLVDNGFMGVFTLCVDPDAKGSCKFFVPMIVNCKEKNTGNFCLALSFSLKQICLKPTCPRLFGYAFLLSTIVVFRRLIDYRILKCNFGDERSNVNQNVACH